MVTPAMFGPRKKRFFASSCLLSAFLLAAAFFIGSALLVADYRERILGCYLDPIKVTKSIEVAKSDPCQDECRPEGTETLPRGFISTTTDLEMRPLYGLKKSKSPTNLVAIAVGIKQKKNVNEIVKKFPLTDFPIMLFHYDGNVDGWKDLKWTNSATHVSAMNQTKWWFAKRYLHPDVAQYDYIFLWDEDLGVENFHAGRYLSIIKKEGLEISQPAIDQKSDVHYRLTTRKMNSTVHRNAVNLHGPGRKCYEDSTEPPCTGFVEMMAPVFSRASWRCTWFMIQNDLVYGWGLDFQLGYCAQGDRTKNIGIVDSEYVIHFGLPTLGGSTGNKTSGEIEKQLDDRNAVRKASYRELENFKNRWKKAAREDDCWVDPYQQTAKSI